MAHGVVTFPLSLVMGQHTVHHQREPQVVLAPTVECLGAVTSGIAAKVKVLEVVDTRQGEDGVDETEGVHGGDDQHQRP